MMPRTLAAVVVLLGTAPARADDKAVAAPVDFIADAKLYYRVVACKGSDPVPANLDAAIVEKHCAEMAKRHEYFTKNYIVPAQTFFAQLRPAAIPTTVVYPFGGGDLASALVTFPDAREITTISLEHSGDPTKLAKLTRKWQLAPALSEFRAAIAGLLSLNDSTSENMRKLEKGGIPGQLSFHLTGMAANGFEPVSLKFFRFEPDGTLHYYTQPEITALAKHKAKKIKSGWTDTDWSKAFAHMELTFRKAGDPKAPLVVHRHVAGNLANNEFVGSPLEKYLLSKGKIVALTKAASYLIWNGGFSGIRDYLLANMVWMASDATGISPKAAKKAGFDQITYGKFTGPFLDEAEGPVAREMVELWESQPIRKLPFRYGYPDNELNIHLMITQPVGPKKQADK
jgi:hypothetical protein